MPAPTSDVHFLTRQTLTSGQPLATYDYAYVRVVPYVHREEFLNAGVILFCRTKRFLDARVDLDVASLHQLAPRCDKAALQSHLALIPRICRGEGEIGALPLEERFHWLTTPRSTVIQVSDVHSGLCTEPEKVLARLSAELIERG